MADLFLSYKSEDRARVKPLVDALQADGLSVWWDAQIEGGAGWRQAIQRELDGARCVLVAWTKRSVGPEGEFVHDEATRAKRRGVYLPVLLDAVEPPLGFGEKQAMSLVGWKGNREDPRYQAVLAAAKAIVAGAAVPAPVAAAQPSGLGRRAAIGGGLALGAAALAGGGWWLLRPEAAQASDSIAVLPFANLSGDPAKAYFSDGIAEELRSALSRIAGLQVAARISSEKMRDTEAKEAAAKLGVAHVLTGSVRKGGGTIRVSTQLLNGATGLETWSQVYDRPEGDALVVQTSIAESVANALSLSLGKAAAMLGGTKNPAAYDAYLRGLAIRPKDEAMVQAIIAMFDAAIAADPDFAAAHANRSVQLSNLFGVFAIADAAMQAEAAALRAIALAPALPIAQWALAFHRESVLDFRGAAETYDKLLRLPGVGSRELGGAALFKAYMGRGHEALALVDKAIALDPLNPQTRRQRIDALIAARQGKAALAEIEAFDAANPGDRISAANKGLAFQLLGQPKEMAAAFGEDAEPWRRHWGQAIAYAMLGDRAGSDKALAALKAIDDGTLHYQFASIRAARGETDMAFAELDRAIATRDPGLVNLRTSPEFDPLRKDPRYAAIEKRLGFPPL